MSTGELAKAIAVSPRTLQRRKQEGAFQVDESDRLVNPDHAAASQIEELRRVSFQWDGRLS